MEVDIVMCLRLVVAAVLCSGMAALVGAQEKKPADAPKQPDPKAAPQPPAPKPADPKAPQPPTPKPADPKAPQPPTPKPADPKTPQPPTPKPADPKTPQPPTPPAPGGTRFEPRFKDEKGALIPYHQKMVTTVAQGIKVQNQDLTQKQESTFYFTWTPLRQEGDKWVVKQRVDALKMKIDISGNPIEYDSTTKEPTGAASNPGLVEFFKNLEGAEFTATLDKNYKVEKVDGREDFVKRLAAGNAQMNTLLDKILTQEALRQMVDPTFGVVSPTAQAVGGEWKHGPVTLPLGPIGSYDVTYTFKYVGKDATQKEWDRIEVTTELKYKAPTETTEGLLFRITGGTLTASNPEKGYILYDPKTGRIRSAKVVIKLDGDLSVTIGGAPTKVELRQEQTTVITGQDEAFKEVPAKK